ncbi:MFS transporter [Massilia sp. CCM 8733]|uniref:Multidrug transporter MdfA n=1 Tax=Massilia mucilaginosa TaxID=2609282 RepID=A0ABX0NV13_9BURK|nr:MFS transporter [Massilia mucilaginosa]NHZ90692.1 MFS transporter [Massilia mucilaginosa]
MFEKRQHLLYFSLFFILYELTVYLSNDMIMPAMPQVVREFQASNRHIGLSLSLFILGGSMLQIFLGPIADRIGKRKVMLAGVTLYLVATAFVPFSSSIGQFLTARFFQGMGSCFIFIGYAAIHELFDDAEAVKLTAMLSNTTVFAPLIGPVVGSAVISMFPWQSIFGIGFVLGCIAWLGLFTFMPRTEALKPPADLASIRASYLTIVRNKKFMAGILIAAMAITPLTAWIGLSPLIIMEHMGKSYGTYILYQLVIFSGFIISTMAIQKLGDGFSLTRLIRQGAGLAVIGMLGAGLVYRHGHLFIVCMFIFSAGFGLFNGALIRLSLTATGVSMNLTSSAMSLLYCVTIAGGVEIYNLVCAHFNYSLASYALFNVPLGVVIGICLLRFASKHDGQETALAQAPQAE